VKATATDAASNVADKGRSAAEDVRSQTTGGTTDESHGAHVAGGTEGTYGTDDALGTDETFGSPPRF
jgi:hypothetical protein